MGGAGMDEESDHNLIFQPCCVYEGPWASDPSEYCLHFTRVCAKIIPFASVFLQCLDSYMWASGVRALYDRHTLRIYRCTARLRGFPCLAL